MYKEANIIFYNGKNLLLYFNIIDKQELRACEKSVQILSEF